jgi:hypothetical protein
VAAERTSPLPGMVDLPPRSLQLGFTLGCPVELVQPNTWKAGSMGAGWGSCTPEQYLKWAQEHAGYTGTLEDEAAGILIATAAGVKEAACVVV